MNEIIFPLLTGRIVISNKKKKFEKIFSFFKAFIKKKKVFGAPYNDKNMYFLKKVSSH